MFPGSARRDPAATMDSVSQQAWTAACRIQGSKGVDIWGNDLQLLEYNQGIASSALRLDEMAYSPTLRRRNGDITFQNNRVRGGTRLYDLKDFDTLTIGGNSWINATNDATLRTVFEVSPSNESIYRMGDISGTDEVYIGASYYLSATGGGTAPEKRGRFRAAVRTMVTNKRQADAPPQTSLFRMDWPVFNLIEITGMNVLGYPLQAFDFWLSNSAGVTLIVRDSVFAERLSGGLITAGGTPVNGSDPATSLTVVTTIGNSTVDPAAYRRQPAGLYVRTYGA